MRGRVLIDVRARLRSGSYPLPVRVLRAGRVEGDSRMRIGKFIAAGVLGLMLHRGLAFGGPIR